MKFTLLQFTGIGKPDGFNQEDLLRHRRNVLFSRFALFGFFVVVAHVIADAVQGLIISVAIDSAIGMVILTAFGLNERGRHLTARIMFLIFLNFTLALYCSVIPKHNGVFLFYFPLIGLSSVVFDAKYRRVGLSFVGLSSVLLWVLVLTDFKLVGDFQIPALPERKSLTINLISSSLILVMCIHFIMKYNDESETRFMNLADEIRQKNSYLEKANSELDRFVYSASHDLRAPLLSIQGVVNIARMELATPKMGDYLTMIRNQALKLDNFIKDIVCYSRNERTAVFTEPVDVREVLDEVCEELRFLHGAGPIRMEKDIEDGAEWKTDRCRLNTIFSNMISNAIKYRNMDCDDPWVRVAFKKNPSDYSIMIADNGVGIPPEHQPKVFEMFYRAHDHSSGSGLGLYIVKEVVGKMNGKIQLQSEPGIGSTFTITLPATGAGKA